ncbi:MAG: type II secretion system protein [Patescibacteria group bacterium]
MQSKQVKGFTLIELLIVIGIIAILATVVILTLNPAELLRQARDSTRASDFSTLKSAISLYAADVSSPVFGTSSRLGAGTGWCFISITSGPAFQAGWPTSTASCNSRASSTLIGVVASTTEGAKRGVDGTGWIPINFNSISSGAPLSALPVDPVTPNTPGTNILSTSDDRYYVYLSDGVGGFEVNGVLESLKYASSSENDGGSHNTAANLLYEVGTDPGLDL